MNYLLLAISIVYQPQRQAAQHAAERSAAAIEWYMAPLNVDEPWRNSFKYRNLSSQ